ncbi:MAG: ABC transporter substrate-binding protein [Rhizobiales bacterium]|nr:ABC transporter substrate-binding protein [Hyphomicrobiales bacterium]
MARHSIGLRRVAAMAVVAALGCGATAPASAQDKLKVAIGQIDAWANQVPTLGMRAGIFQKHGIVLENFGTQGAGETLQAVISGSADIGIGVGTPGAMRAFAKGAPVRVLAAGYTGVGDIYWFVPSNSPIKDVKDITDKHTIAYSNSGSTSDSVLRALIAYYGLKAKPTSTGGPPPTLTMTMSGQIDIGWSVAPFGLKELQAKTIRVIMRGSELPSMRNQTVRVEIVNANALKERHDVMVRFMRAYRETLDWMYSDPLAVKYYSESMRLPESLVEMQRKEFNPKAAIDPDKLSDLELVMQDAIAGKFLEKPLSKEQLAEFIQIPPR